MPRPAPKKRQSGPVKNVVEDIKAGYGELKRQSGAAVANIKAGIQKIKQAVKR